VKDMPSLFDPYMVKHVHESVRQIVTGYEEYETKSTTHRENGESETLGSRERMVHETFIEKRPEFMKLQEQERERMKEFVKLGPGQGFVNYQGNVTKWQVPYLVQWIGEMQERMLRIGFEPTPLPSNNWLKKASSTQHKLLEGRSNDSPSKNESDLADLF